MAEMYAVSGSVLTDIADAIRTMTGNPGPIEVADMAAAIRNGMDYLKFGVVYIPAVQNPNTNHTVTSLSELGFLPIYMVMLRAERSTADGAVHITEVMRYGDEVIRKNHRWINNDWGNQSSVVEITTGVSGGLWLDGDVIKVKSTTNYNFPAGDYAWIAVGEPNT